MYLLVYRLWRATSFAEASKVVTLLAKVSADKTATANRYRMPTFTRAERLKSAKAIGGLFKGGHSYVAYPLRVVWKEAPPYLASMSRAQIVVSVSKRNFKTAVARNRLKRQIREAYRLQKQAFYDKLEASNLHISLMISYIAKEALPYAEIEAGLAKVIRKFPGEKK